MGRPTWHLLMTMIIMMMIMMMMTWWLPASLLSSLHPSLHPLSPILSPFLSPPPLHPPNLQPPTSRRMPIYISGVDANETFGQPYDIPNCPDEGTCYNRTTRTKFWGESKISYGPQALWATRVWCFIPSLFLGFDFLGAIVLKSSIFL